MVERFPVQLKISILPPGASKTHQKNTPNTRVCEWDRSVSCSFLIPLLLTKVLSIFFTILFRFSLFQYFVLSFQPPFLFLTFIHPSLTCFLYTFSSYSYFSLFLLYSFISHFPPTSFNHPTPHLSSISSLSPPPHLFPSFLLSRIHTCPLLSVIPILFASHCLFIIQPHSGKYCPTSLSIIIFHYVLSFVISVM